MSIVFGWLLIGMMLDWDFYWKFIYWIVYIKYVFFYLLLNIECELGLYGDDCDKWCFCKDRKLCDCRYGYCLEKEC